MNETYKNNLSLLAVSDGNSGSVDVPVSSGDSNPAIDITAGDLPSVSVGDVSGDLTYDVSGDVSGNSETVVYVQTDSEVLVSLDQIHTTLVTINSVLFLVLLYLLMSWTASQIKAVVWKMKGRDK